MARAALDSIFEANFFSICKVDALLKTLGRPQKGRAYDMLHALHCRHYDEMNADTRSLIPLLINELLATPPTCIATDEALKNVSFED
jgi:hypothetical protein